MIRITALNECTELEVPAEDLEVTKEAQVGAKCLMIVFCSNLNSLHLIFKRKL